MEAVMNPPLPIEVAIARYIMQGPASSYRRNNSEEWEEAATMVRDAYIMPSLREATMHFRGLWLTGYKRRNGPVPEEIRKVMKDPLCGVYFATKDFELTPLYGDCALHIIVPRNVSFYGSKTGDSVLYLMKGFRLLREALAE